MTDGTAGKVGEKHWRMRKCLKEQNAKIFHLFCMTTTRRQVGEPKKELLAVRIETRNTLVGQ